MSFLCRVDGLSLVDSRLLLSAFCSLSLFLLLSFTLQQVRLAHWLLALLHKLLVIAVAVGKDAASSFVNIC